MQIQILSTTIIPATTKTGKPYDVVEVAYKNLTFQGKVEGRKIMPFGNTADTHAALKSAQPGQVFDVTVVKNEAGYNDWTSVKLSDGTQPAPVPSAINSPKAAIGAGRSTYETPEERAQRQILIVRQSSVGHALTLLSLGAKTAPKLDEVLETAQQISDFVFQIKSAGPSGFEDLPDFDVPVVQ